jgi:hypothetical protein
MVLAPIVGPWEAGFSQHSGEDPPIRSSSQSIRSSAKVRSVEVPEHQSINSQ